MSNHNNNRKFTIKLFTVSCNDGHEEDSDFNNGFHKSQFKKEEKVQEGSRSNIESETERRNYEEDFRKVEP